jgi:hypothetical protein
MTEEQQIRLRKISDLIDEMVRLKDELLKIAGDTSPEALESRPALQRQYKEARDRFIAF